MASTNNNSTDYDGTPINVKGSEHTLNIPLRVQYRYEIIRNLSVFIYTGPSFDIHLALVRNWNGEVEELYHGDSYLNRFQMLWGVGAGVRWKGLQLMMGGDWGLMPFEKESIHKLNKPFFISLSYLF